MADVGTGVTLTFETGIIATATSISWSGIERPAVDVTHLGTATARAFMPGDLYDPGELTVEFQLATDAAWGGVLAEPGDTVRVEYVAEVIDPPSDAEYWQATGFLTGLEMNAPLEDVLTGTATIKFSGEITFVEPA